VKAPTLVDFWTDNFKLLVEARSGTLHIKTTGEYWPKTYDLIDEVQGLLPTKRRRLSEPPTGLAEELFEREIIYETQEMGVRFTDDLGGGVHLSLLSALISCPQRIIESREIWTSRAKDRQRYET
jgi:hypothetical protein